MTGIIRFVVVATLAVWGRSALAQVRVEAERGAMGTVFRIVACAPDTASGDRALSAAFARIEELDRVLSDYDPGSEVSVLAASYEPGVPVRVSGDLARAVALADAWWRRTGGTFDAALGALTRRWRRAMRHGVLPDENELEGALAASGWRHVRWQPSAAEVAFDVPGVRFDFGGMGKGHAADEALETLRSAGIGSAIVDAGGDVVAGDPPPGEPGWIVALPEESGGGFVVLERAAIATSGDRYRSVRVDGVRYSHILDPATGVGRTERRTVTVLAPDGATADALATAFSAGDPDGLRDLVPESARAVLLTTEGGTRLEIGSLPILDRDLAHRTDCRAGNDRLD